MCDFSECDRPRMDGRRWCYGHKKQRDLGQEMRPLRAYRKLTDAERNGANSAYAKKYRDKKKELLRTRKDVPCTDCRIKYPHYVMDFDHVRGNKLFNISQSLEKSLTELKVEIGKCEVVCANCHRIRTWKRSH